MATSLKWLTARPIAHRGLHDEKTGAIENSQTAFARAIAGNYAIECDLQISADGEAMVFHDPNLARLTAQTGDFNTLTVKELKQVSFKNSSDEIQTLGELLLQVDGKVGLLIELKSLVDGDMRLADRAVKVLNGYNGHFALMSFSPMLMGRVKVLSPQTKRGAVIGPTTEELWLSTSGEQADGENMLKLVDPDFVSYDVRQLPSNFITGFRSETTPVITWTIRDQKKADFAYEHCDQITFEGFTPK